MLRAYVLDFGRNWGRHLLLMEFAYNKSYQSTIGISPFEALYSRRCRLPICREEFGDKIVLDPDII